MEVLQNWIQNMGIAQEMALTSSKIIGLLLLMLLAWITDRVTKRYILHRVSLIVAKTKSDWDDTLLKYNFFGELAHLSPIAVLYLLVPFIFEEGSKLIFYIQTVLTICMFVILVLLLESLLNTFQDIYNSFNIAQQVPIKSFIQVAKLFNYFFGGIFIISLIINKTPLFLISGLGAMTAVLLFIFKDAILGLVAGIQLTANKMMRIGDWIEIPKYGADGDVLEVGLTTVKIQNFDRTITMVPTYALISESFKNWRGMKESGGRRIKRAIHIDINTIKFCSEEMINRFEEIQYIAQYVQTKKHELGNFNKKVVGENQSNYRRLTNIGILRAYLDSYLRNHPLIHPDMTFLIRQLKPTHSGLPIEIYVFSTDNDWVNYEAIQSDIFDHVLAIVPEFDLRLFQNPTGSDFQSIVNS